MTLEQLNELIEKDEIGKVFRHLSKLQLKDNTFAQLQKEYVGERKKDFADRLIVYLSTVEERLALPTLAKPALNSEQEHAALDLLREKSNKPALTTQEAAELYQLKVQIYKEMLENTDKKLAKHYPHIIFEKLLFSDKLEQIELNELSGFVKNPTFEWYEKTIVVAALTLSAVRKFDVIRLNLLTDFIFEAQEQVWQRALSGLVLALHQRENKLSLFPDLAKKLNNLQQMEYVGEGLGWLEIAFRNQTFKDDYLEIENLSREHEFFKKPQHWFLPFYENNEILSQTIEQTKHNIGSDFVKTLLQTTYIANSDKYLFCLNLDSITHEILSKRIERFSKTTTNNFVFENFLIDIYHFHQAFPKEELNAIFQSQILLYNSSLLDILASESKKKEIQANYFVGRAAIEQDIEAKIQLIQRAIEIKPDRALYWNHLGNIYHDDIRDYEKAVESFQKAVEIKSDEVIYWDNLRLAYYNTRNYEKAVEYYQKVVEVEPNNHLAWNSLGTIYASIENYEKAIECYQKILEIMPDDNNYWSRLGYIYYFYLSNYEKAIECYEKAIKIKPNEAVYWNNLGNVYHNNLKNYEKAIESFQKAIKIKPDEAVYWYNLGNTYANLENNEKAIESYQKSIEIDPDDEDYWFSLAKVYAQLSQYEKAKEICLKIPIKEGNIYKVDEWQEIIGDFLLISSLVQLKKYDVALDFAWQIAQTYPQNSGTWFTLGALYGEKKEYDKAREYLFKAFDISPNNFLVVANFSQLESLQSNKIESLKYLQKAIVLNPDWKEDAKTDTDFEWLWEDEDFKALVA